MSSVYVRTSYAKVAQTVEMTRHGQLTGDYNVDLDANGNVVGIEVLNAKAVEVDGVEVL